MKMFVYGTLKKGFRNHKILGNSKFLGDATIKGFQMYDLGYFPGIKEEPNGVVEGEIYEIDDETLVRVDRLEGEGRLYLRQITAATMDNKELEVSIYVFNRGVEGCLKVDRNWRKGFNVRDNQRQERERAQGA